MKSIIEAVSFTMQEEERQWFADEIPVLRAELTTPQCCKQQSCRVARRLNRYYRQCARAFLAYCNHYMYPQALNAFEQARQAGAPLPCAAAQLHCTVTCNQNQVFSLYIDCTEWAGTKDALTLRRADTWNLATGDPISLKDCFPSGAKPRRRCLEAVRLQCAQQQEAGKAIYAEHLDVRLRRYFNGRNFYLSDGGLHFFYQPCCIAPAFEGCPTFFLPFSSENGPLWPLNPHQNLAK